MTGILSISETEFVLEMASFTEADQQGFGRLSGDTNPVHLSASAARRTMFGRPIVHGMHLVLRALEALDMAGFGEAFRTLSVRFNRPVFLHEPLSLRARREDARLELTFLSDGAPLVAISLSNPAIFADWPWRAVAGDWPTEPRSLPIEEMASIIGDRGLPYEACDIVEAFPGVARAYGVNVVAGMLGITRVVGMEAPGLHSMLATLSLQLVGGPDSRLAFKVSRVSEKTSHVQVAFNSGALTGTAQTFVRPVIAPTAIEEVARHVEKGEFAGRRALIVGGSRGLGLLTAYMIAEGGGDVVLTYHMGADEADEAVDAIARRGAAARCVKMDIAEPQPALEWMQEVDFIPTDIFYFATPHIFNRKKKLFEKGIFDSFIDAYVSHFVDIVQDIAKLSGERVAVFYPSSDALNAPLKDLAEYYIAKMAGEAACHMLASYAPGLFVVSERMPRLPTDQTASLMKVQMADPIPLLLQVCRRMANGADVAQQHRQPPAVSDENRISPL